jgi:GT2 family glycosyltransferase
MLAIIIVSFNARADLDECLASIHAHPPTVTPFAVVVVDNASTSYHRERAIAPRFAHEGWDATVVDGGDHEALEQALTRTTPRRPTVVVAEVEEKS